MPPDLLPLADGGDGTLDAMLVNLGGETVSARVRDPLGREIEAGYGLVEEGGTALVEMAAASGLPLVAEDERDAWAATTYGTGQLIVDAVRGGAGDPRRGGRLRHHRRRRRRARGDRGCRRPGGAKIVVLSDVQVPWERCAEVFGPQKGADPEMVKRLAQRLDELGARSQGPRGVAMTGAAGGLSGGLWAVHGATLEPGAPWILDALDFDARMRASRAVVTGEGKLDEQTLQGKLVGEIGTRTRQAGVPLHAIVGTDALDAFGKRMIDLQVVTAATTLEEIEAAGEDLAGGSQPATPDARALQPRGPPGRRAAQDQARGMGHSQVGTEHLLLGLIAEETGAAGRAFAQLGVTLDAARDAIMALVRPGEPTPPDQPIPFSPRAKGTLEASLRQAMGFKDKSSTPSTSCSRC